MILRLLCDPSGPFWAHVCAQSKYHRHLSLHFKVRLILGKSLFSPTIKLTDPVPSGIYHQTLLILLGLPSWVDELAVKFARVPTPEIQGSRCMISMACSASERLS